MRLRASRERRPASNDATGPRTRGPRAATAASWLADAERYLVGGVNSPVRAFKHLGMAPMLLRSGQGATVSDVSSRALLDLIMGWGALILGHRHPAVVRALREALERSTVLGLTHPTEAALAALVVEAVESVEQIRFTTSGSEACMSAVRLARAVTKRDVLVMCDGAYHGHGDSLLVGQSQGIPEPLAALTVKVPYNDPEAFERLMRAQGERIACVIIEPVAANMGVIAPHPDFLARLRALTREYGALLIFDEVVTGFRVAWGGAQARYRVPADLTIFGKIIGGGLPIGAFAGPTTLMQHVAPAGPVFHGGTFAGHPFAMSAGLATLKTLSARPPYSKLEALGARLADGLRQAARAAGVALQVNQVGSIVSAFFAARPVTDGASAFASSRDAFAQWARALLAEGILVPPSPVEAWFLSTAHTDEQVERVIEVSQRVWTKPAAARRAR